MFCRPLRLLILSCLLLLPGSLLAGQVFEFRTDDTPYLDLSWNLPISILQRNHNDYSLFYSKVKSYSTCEANSGLKSSSEFEQDLGRVLLDTPARRKAYYQAEGRNFSPQLETSTERILQAQYRGVSRESRETLFQYLVEAYDALLACDEVLYQRTLENVQQFLLATALVKQPAEALPLEALKLKHSQVKATGFGRYLDTPIKAPYLDCKAFGHPTSSIPFRRLVLDPGHFGGTGVTDSREYRGYREGRAAFIVANLAKAYLVDCLGVDRTHVMLTRDNLYTIYGNGHVTFRNFALMDYRTELLALLDPDAVISIHTNGGDQRITGYYPDSSPTYYYYRNRGDLAAPPQTMEISEEFSRVLVSGLAQKLYMTSASEDRKRAFLPTEPPQAYPGEEKIFHNVLDRGIPLTVLEGMSHEGDQMLSKLTLEENLTESIWVDAVEYRYSPLLRWYAEGIVCGIVMYAAQSESCN